MGYRAPLDITTRYNSALAKSLDVMTRHNLLRHAPGPGGNSKNGINAILLAFYRKLYSTLLRVLLLGARSILYYTWAISINTI